MVLAALALAAGAAAEPSFLVPSSRAGFPDWLRGPLAGVLDVRPGADTFSLLLLSLCGCYLLAVACAEAVGPRLALAVLAALHAVFLLAPPLLTTDVFGYLAYAELGADRGLNPYENGANPLAGEPLHGYQVWHNRPSPYGPLFTVATYPLASVGLAVGMWTIKVASAAASIGCLALVWAGARRLGRDPLRATLLVGLNPLVLVYVVGGAHNDVFIALLLSAAVYLAVAGRERLGAAALVAAAAIKMTAAPVLPFLVAGSRSRARAVTAALLAAGALTLTLFAALGPGLASYPAALDAQGDLVSKHSVPHYAGALLGLGGATDGVRLMAGLALAVALLALLVRAWRGADWIACAGWATLALLLTTVWLMPWYAIWLLPLAALARGRALSSAALGLTVFVVLTRVPLTSP